MLVSSLMNLISMLMAEACENPEAAAENRHLRRWLTVSYCSTSCFVTSHIGQCMQEAEVSDGDVDIRPLHELFTM